MPATASARRPAPLARAACDSAPDARAGAPRQAWHARRSGRSHSLMSPLRRRDAPAPADARPRGVPRRHASGLCFTAARSRAHSRRHSTGRWQPGQVLAGWGARGMHGHQQSRRAWHPVACRRVRLRAEAPGSAPWCRVRAVALEALRCAPCALAAHLSAPAQPGVTMPSWRCWDAASRAPQRRRMRPSDISKNSIATSSYERCVGACPNAGARNVPVSV